MKTDLSYKITKNIPNISTQLIQISPNPSGALSSPEGKEQLFYLPRYGIMQDLWVNSQLTAGGTAGGQYITGTAASTQTSGFGMNLFQAMELRSHNRIICTNDDNYIRVRTDCEKFGRGEGVRYRSRAFSSDGVSLVSTWASAAVVWTYTPFYCSFTEKPENYLDLNFIEQLQLRLVWNTDSLIGFASPLVISTVTTYVWMYYYNMQSDDLASLRARNFSPERPLIMLGYDKYTESGLVGASVTTYTVSLKNNNATFATHLCMRDTVAGFNNNYYQITSFSFQCNGRTIYNSVPTPIATWLSDRFGGAGLMVFDQNTGAPATALTAATHPNVCLQDIRPISLYWGLDPSDRTYNSGALAYHNVNNPQVVLNFASSASTTSYYVVHEFWQLVSVNPNDGVVSVSIST